MFLQGFRLVENLEEYTGLKVAYLEGNGLVEISGLEAQKEMRSLYLHENCIDRIQGLGHMVSASHLTATATWAPLTRCRLN